MSKKKTSDKNNNLIDDIYSKDDGFSDIEQVPLEDDDLSASKIAEQEDETEKKLGKEENESDEIRGSVSPMNDENVESKSNLFDQSMGTIAAAYGNRGHLPRKSPDDKVTRYLYISFLVVGFFLILLGKALLNVPVTFITAVAAIAVVFYGFFTAFVQRHNPVRVDRVGDNCYYLGLTYTLASLIAALLALKGDVVGRALLENFGIALISTAVGIIMRLVLMQFRTEIDDAETEARIRLIDASEDFRQQLFSAKADFENFQTALLLSMERSNAQMSEFLHTQAVKLTNSMNDSADKITKRSIATDELIGVLENRFEVLETYILQMGRSAEALAKRMDDIHTTPRVIDEAFAALNKNLNRSSEIMQNSVKLLSEKSELVSDSEKSIVGFEKSLERVNTAIITMEKSIEVQAATLARSEQILETQAKSLQSYTEKAEAQGERMRVATEQVYSSLGDLAQMVIKGVKGG